MRPTNDPDHQATDRQKTVKKSKADQKQNLLDKGWTHDGVWYHSPYTGVRYTLQAAMDVEYLRAEWSGPGALDWTKRNTWANQHGSSEDE